MEKIDIYDANLKHLGIMDRKDAHLQGLWHTTFHCWLINNTNGGQILLQGRSSDMENFPDMLDVSAAGHILAGEKIDEGVREVEEELGIIINIKNLRFLGYRVEVADQTNGQKNREYQAVYLLKHDPNLFEYRPQIEEVDSLFWLNIDDGINLLTGKQNSVKVKGIKYDKSSKNWTSHEREITINELLPRIQSYYLTVLIMGQRFLSDNTLPLAIS